MGRIQKAKRMNHIFCGLMKTQNLGEEGSREGSSGGGSGKGRFGSDHERH